MDHLRSSNIRRLEQFMTNEAKLLTKLQALSNEERDSLTKLNSDEVQSLSSKRGELITKLAELQGQRLELMKSLGAEDKERLCDFISNRCSAAERAILNSKLEILKGAANETTKLTKEIQQISSFSLSMINSLVSIFSSARQGISRSYSGSGSVKEAVHQQNRESNVLKKA